MPEIPEEDLYDVDYEELQQQYDDLVAEYEDLEEELSEAYDEYSELEDQLEEMMVKYAEAVAKEAWNLAKLYADCISDILNMLAALLAIIAGLEAALAGLLGVIAGIAALTGAEPVAAGVGIGAGTVAIGSGLTGAASGAAWLGSALMGELSEDPPQPAYKKVVHMPLVKRLQLPMRGKAKVGVHLAKMVHSQFRINTLSPHMLNAMERYQGAHKAGDMSYMRRHGKVLGRMASSSRRATGSMKKSLLTAAKQLDGKPYNYKIVPSDMKKIVAVLKKQGLPKPWLDGLRSVGMTPAQITEYTKWVVSYDYSKFKEAKLSWHFRTISFKLHSAELKLKPSK